MVTGDLPHIYRDWFEVGVHLSTLYTPQAMCGGVIRVSHVIIIVD